MIVSKAKSQLLPCLGIISPPVGSQSHDDSIYCKLSNISEISRTVVLKLLLSDRYQKSFNIFFLIGNFCINLRKIFLLKNLGDPKRTCLGPSFFIKLITEFVM
jgi:hypothetical protein